jgi:hypothetical protein
MAHTCWFVEVVDNMVYPQAKNSDQPLKPVYMALSELTNVVS